MNDINRFRQTLTDYKKKTAYQLGLVGETYQSVPDSFRVLEQRQKGGRDFLPMLKQGVFIPKILMKILLTVIVLTLGCGVSPRTQFPRYYYGMDIITFEATYPNIETFPKESPQCVETVDGISFSYRRYILPDKRVMQANLRNGKIYELYVRQPN